MPVFRSPSDLGRLGHSTSFYDVLVEHLRGLASAAKLSLPRLDITSEEGMRFSEGRRADFLLVHEGKALAAVEIQAAGSTYMHDVANYIGVKAYAGAGGDLNSMAERLQAQLREGMPPTEEEKPVAPVLRELEWRMNLRVPGALTREWTGGPFDIDRVEAAFEVIVQVILERAKT